ncbi:calcium-transporting ATPase 8, plasma membrane-type [Physcomitrium patens]|uniref:Calcium-transporting ATPase n=1 Tax=Physcomitrium patens TaxID=3218 RepID=Q70TF0_PHYPA|nr:calcium-transporting ATPase 8, plasma membrane-type-like [Physcomitrium patens]XP_024382481.1 calcium-transporting ATPase 8, plasma membrane-type-like [Physcomitrium patens]PNR49455.1 hypothetical protein PHYPA_011351 [Physcomitrium patens]CAD21958.1 putative plasma membrane calcium-transporting ATPase [Physcomitrium patens]CAD67616.1 calcium-dependent ATPase [Physcomitrium patens]|eukprot:XP_024382480.1 calcium-transporting ATPase 8, plasma membrane-type-like [Physcomitrella patens]
MNSFHESGDKSHSKEDGDAEDSHRSHNPFIIEPKGSIDRLKEWRKVTFTVNAARRFRYTLDIKKFEEQQKLKKDPASRLRAGTDVILAVERFKKAGRGAEQDEPPEGFQVGPKTLVHMLQDRKVSDLEKLGGIHGLGGKLDTNLEDGVKDKPEEIQRRKDAYGSNTYPKKKPKGLLHFVWEAMQDTTLIILIVAAIVSLGAEMWSQGVKTGWYDGTAILVAVLLVIVTTAGSDYKQSLQFRNLNEEKENIHLDVVRGGERKQISIWDIVVGDVIPLSIGGQVPADGVLIEGHSLSIDESTMTGESEPVKKDSKRPYLLSGCKVLDGQGLMLVTGVGVNTEWGQVMASVSEDNGEETPLQVRLNGVATFIGKVGLTVAGVVFIILIIRFFTIDFKQPENRKSSNILTHIVEIFSIAVVIVVVAVPEGLPLAVTLTLAYSMRKMMADKSLVRHLSACETMGSATTICSDKTGTLTTNKMTAVRAWVANAENNAASADGVPESLRQTLIHSICLNSTGTVAPPKEGTEPVVSGSPTESACLGWGLKLGMEFKKLRHATTILHVETFNSTKKRAGVVFKNDQGVVEAHWKGAAEIILSLCSKFVNEHGEVQTMTPEKNEELKRVIEGMAAQSLRCIAFAYRPIDGSDVPSNEESSYEWNQPDEDLIFMAICGIKDPCRPGVRDAVERCQKAGVKVRMVTGDNKFTAKAIAQECGILTEGGLVVEGPDFRTWDEARIDRDIEKLVVMARSSPTDKLKLVKALKQRSNVVAVTGDGTNDAPALHEADIGLSMGIAGTEVAKESSDIIILDDNFTSVVKVVRWGRSVYANIQKFIQFQLTVNVTALTINFVASISTGEVPLTAVQLLWVNLIMDTLGALALATEPPTDDLMDRKPVGRTEPLISNIMWRNIFAQAIFQVVVLLTLNFAGNKILGLTGPDKERDLLRTTIIFNSFVFCQIFNEINARRPDKFNIFEGIHKNYLFLGIILIEVILQFVIVQFLNKFAQTTKLNAKWWGFCIAIGFISWPVAFISKFVPVPKKQFQPNLTGCCRGRNKKSSNEEVVPGLSEVVALEPNEQNDDGDKRTVPVDQEINHLEKRSAAASAV